MSNDNNSTGKDPIKFVQFSVDNSKEMFVDQLRTCIDLIVKYFEEQISRFELAYWGFERNYPYTEYNKYEDDQTDAAEARNEDVRLSIE